MKMKARILISAIFLGLGLIIAAIPQNTTHTYKLSPEQVLIQAYGRTQYFRPEELADLLINKDPSIRLIDVRDPEEFEKFSLPNAINIPLQDLLSEDWRPYIDQDRKMNVFYSNGSLKANEAWMISMQLGYKNNYVLEGGLNYWAEVIMNPEKPSSTSPNEEFARYDFRKGAGMALGGGALIEQASSSVPAAKPQITPRPQKKRAAGGC